MEQDQEILETQLEPILKYFDDETVIEIMLKADGSVIVESFKTGMHVVPERIEEAQKEIIARILAHQEEKKILFQNYSMPSIKTTTVITTTNSSILKNHF